MKTHEVKIDEKYLDRILNDQKKFEVRFNDRDYQVGDLLNFDPGRGYLIPSTGNYKYKFLYKITYIHSLYGMQSNFVVLGIEKYNDC